MGLENNSIIVSSRVRLARNLADYPFPASFRVGNGSAVANLVIEAFLGLDKFKVYTMQQLPDIDSVFMQEKHLISPNLVRNKDSGVVLLNSDETVSIMVNEEDHIRAQCILPQLNLSKAYNILSALDDGASQKLNFAFSDDLGYLTACVTNVGTGLRASVMMFLPALCLSGKMPEIIENLRSNKITVRGVFGECSSYDGYMFQISNNVSLGMSEREIITHVENIVNRISDLELKERKNLLVRNDEIKDMVLRAYGTLTNCFLLSSSEFVVLTGQVKLGIALNIISFKDNFMFDKMVEQCLPAGLTKIAGTELNVAEDLKFRAKYVKNILLKSRVK